MSVRRRFLSISGAIFPAGTAPHRSDITATRVGAFSYGNITISQLELAIGDAVVPVLLAEPASDGQETVRRPAALCLHQTTADRGTGHFEVMGLAGDVSYAYGLELAQRGFVTLAPAYPGFAGYVPDVYGGGYESVTACGIANHINATTFLASRANVDPEKLAVIGHSLGGHNAIFVSIFDERFKVIASSAGYTTMQRYAATVPQGDISYWATRDKYMPIISSKYDSDWRKVPVDFPEMIAALAPRAFFTSAPTRDWNFDIAGVRVCQELAHSAYAEKQALESLQVVYPEGEHGAFPISVRQMCYEFIEKHLERQTPNDASA